MKKMPNYASSTISTIMTPTTLSYPLISYSLLSPIPSDTLYLNPELLPVSCLSSENAPRVYAHWIYSPPNFSLNTQSQLPSLYPKNFTRFFLCNYLPVIEAQLNDNDLKN